MHPLRQGVCCSHCIPKGEVMGKVHVDMSMSLDGFVAGPNAGPHNAIGDGGHRIQQWMYDVESWRERQSLQGGQANQDDEVSKERFARTGAYVMGRRMFDEGEVGWPDPPPFRAPVFVLTHQAREPWGRQEQPQARRTSRYRAARPSSGSSSKPGCSRSCRSTSPPCCSVVGCGCSIASIRRMLSSWRSRG